LFIDAFVDILALRMEGLNYAQFTNKFYDKLRIARDLGGSIEEEIAVEMFLKCLQGSRLNRKIVQLMDNPTSSNYPSTVQEAVALMQGVWRTDMAMEENKKNNPDGPQHIVAKGSSSKECGWCGRKGHLKEDCRHLHKWIQENPSRISSDSPGPTPPSQPPDSSDRNSTRKKKGKLAIKGHWENIAMRCTRNRPLDHPSGAITLTLDSGANVSIIGSSLRGTLSNLTPCEDEITGVGGNTSKTTEVGDSRWGPAYVVNGSELNLISLNELRKVATVTMDPLGNTFTATFPDAGSHTFKVDETGLYSCEVPLSSFRLTANIHYNAEQRKRAKMVQELHVLLNHPSEEKMIQLLDSGSLLSCPLTSRDIRTSTAINGPCPDCAVGKLPTPPSPASQSTPAARPGELLHADLINVVDVESRRVPYLTVMDDHTDWVFTIKLPTKKRENVAEAFSKIFAALKSWGHSPGTVRTDPEAVFKSITPDVNNIGYRMEHSGVGRHEKKVERFVRTLKERIRTVRHSLPYTLPRKLTRHLVAAIVSTHNMTPSYRSAPLTPQEIMTGIKPDMKKDLRAPFGTFAVFNTPRRPATRTRGGDRTRPRT
jgi:hypothetical protein